MNRLTHTLDPRAEETASLWAARLDGSELSTEQRQSLDAWLAQHPSHRTLLSAYCQLSTDLEPQLARLIGSGHAAVEVHAPRPSRHRRRALWAGVALAAAAAVAIMVTPGGLDTEQRALATSVNQRQDLRLADGSRVELNAQTSLVVAITATERRVRLASGQAYFAVAPDSTRPFIVETPAGTVRVTGTVFDVRADALTPLEVLVVEGSVQVRPTSTSTPLTLRPGELLVSTTGAAPVVRTLSDAAVEDALAWRRGQIVFQGVPLRTVLERFGRHHGRTLTAAPEVADFPIGGRFSLEDLDGLLDGLEEMGPLQVTSTRNGSVHVQSRPSAP